MPWNDCFTFDIHILLSKDISHYYMGTLELQNFSIAYWPHFWYNTNSAVLKLPCLGVVDGAGTSERMSPKWSFWNWVMQKDLVGVCLLNCSYSFYSQLWDYHLLPDFLSDKIHDSWSHTITEISFKNDTWTNFRLLSFYLLPCCLVLLAASPRWTGRAGTLLG